MSRPAAPVPESPAAPVWRPSPPGDGTVPVAFAGVVTGLALPVLYVAWLNRGGPGTVCHAYAGGEQCTEAWTPWPFVGAAVLFFLAAGFMLRSGLRTRRRAMAAGANVPSLLLGAGWALVGVLGCFSVLSILTIGPFVAPFALLLAAALSGRRNPLPAGLLAGSAAYPLGVLAWLNRRGPVNGCATTTDGGQLCEYLPPPWPFALGAVVCLILAAFLLTSAVRRHRVPEGA